MDFFARQDATPRGATRVAGLPVRPGGRRRSCVAVDLVVRSSAVAIATADGRRAAARRGPVAVARRRSRGRRDSRHRRARRRSVLLEPRAQPSRSRAGGGAVARMLGGTRVGADASDPLRRRLRNVVEEMAIASGVPVPEVYVLEREAGINAFAAGLHARRRRGRRHARRARERSTATSCRA